MESPDLERYKLVTLETLKSLGGIADGRQLAKTSFLSLDDLPQDDSDFDYMAVTRALRNARETLLKEGKVTCADGRIWRLTPAAKQTERKL